MDEFTFCSPLLPRPLTVRQQAAGAIGFKVYPGALLLARFLEEHAAAAAAPAARAAPGAHAAARALGADAVVVELGAGVCGLPALVLGGAAAARAEGGRRACVVATDVPDMLPLLAQNVAAAGVGVDVAPLTWGSTQDVPALAAHLRGRVPSLIVGADIVYHEPLIDPLLDALRRLTEPGAWGEPAGACAPPVLISYVQRFKRAKAFFKKARRWFDIAVVPMGTVVDYDALIWHRQFLAPGGCGGGAEPRRDAAAGAEVGGGAAGGAGAAGGERPPAHQLDSGSADYGRYLRSVCAAGDAARDAAATGHCSHGGGDRGDAASTSRPPAAAAGAAPAPPLAAAPAVYHAVDSDSQDDDPGKSPGIGLFAGIDTSGVSASADAAGAAAAGTSAADDAGASGDDAEGSPLAASRHHRRARPSPQERQLLASATAAAELLGLPHLAEPLDAYVYVLTRRRPP